MSEKINNSPCKMLVIACLQEARDKHLINVLTEHDMLNPDCHVEVTLTVEEIYRAPKKLGIKDF
jgi:hypothetical protein